MTVAWKRIENFPDYEVSNDGQVRSCKFNKVRILSQKAAGVKRAYRTVELWKNKRGTQIYVHQLVLEAFDSKRRQGMECNHKDGTKHNNHISNLEWTTSSGNKTHGVVNGLYPRGERCPWAKLTARDVEQIRLMRAAGMTQQAIADKTLVGRRQIGRILQGTRWKDYGI